jgi:hypothetical protein
VQLRTSRANVTLANGNDADDRFADEFGSRGEEFSM